jgi:hypothetical protein
MALTHNKRRITGTAKPNRENRGAERDQGSRHKAACMERGRPKTVKTPGHGPKDLDAGTATREHVETHHLEDSVSGENDQPPPRRRRKPAR